MSHNCRVLQRMVVPAGARDKAWRESLARHVLSCGLCRESHQTEDFAPGALRDPWPKVLAVADRLSRRGYTPQDLLIRFDAGPFSGLMSEGLPTGAMGETAEAIIRNRIKGSAVTPSDLSEADGKFSHEGSSYHVVLNRTATLDDAQVVTGFVAVKERLDAPLIETGDISSFLARDTSRAELKLVLTPEEVFDAVGWWREADIAEMEEFDEVHDFESLIAFAMAAASILNGVTFKLRPVPEGAKEALIEFGAIIDSEELLPDYERIVRQLLPHLSPEERMLLQDPRVLGRALFMEGLGYMLS